MGLNINGTSVIVETDTLKVKDSSAVTHMSFDGAGRWKRGANAPMFYVCNTTNGWTSMGASGTYYLIPWQQVIVNQNSCFSTTTNVFTAPVTGLYLLSSNLYTYNPAAAGNYSLPVHAVNGSIQTRRYSGAPKYRTRGFGVAQGYASDHDMSDIYYLYAGDYVGLYGYVGGSCSYYGLYGGYSGWFLG